ncbi:MAG: PIN domain-containing protein [Gemmataceae bacterium]
MLLDTDVLVDILRSHPPALAWLKALTNAPIALPGLAAMELVQGCRNVAEQQQVEALLLRCTLHWPSAADCLRAFNDFTAFHLSNNLGLLDALIGETAVGLGLPLATFNLKHYRVIPNLQTVQPY